MGKLHGKTKLGSMLALVLSVMLLIGYIPVEVLAEPIGGTDSSIIENMEDNPITENPTEEPGGDKDNPITENPTEEPDGDEDNSNIENPTEEPDSDKKDANEKDEAGAFVLNLASLKFDFSKINANESLMKFLAKDVEVDMNDPVIEQVSEELDNSDLISGNDTNSGMKRRSLSTADESSEKKELTEEEKAEILHMFAGYLQNYADSAPVLGVQLPFFLNENDNEEDGLGVLGEMLVLAGGTVDEVRDGEQTYDEITGMILTLMLGDQLGVHSYGDVIIGLRDEALDAVKKSSAKTEAQKLLVLNDWLATKVAFNMSYIMNADGSDSMQAEDPQPHNNYDTVYGAVYNIYKDAILEDLKNAAKEQYPYETFLGDLEGQVGEEYFASMTEEDKKAAYENAILDILASDEFTQQLGMHYEEFVDLNAKGAADSLTPAIFNYWEGSIFGTLGEGSAVCLGYTRAYAYLVQCLQPEIYLKEGNDLNSADNWKTNKELYFDENNEIDINKGYVADAVRITFDANVTMYGQTQEGFNSDHFWNAIRVDGKWYYIDPSYNDAYVEVMIRDRVETDGNMSHLYFLLSDTTTEELYEGYHKGIKTLYKEVATDKSYEDSWMVRSISNIFSDKEYFYYTYSSQDLIDQLKESNNSNPDSSMNNDYEYKLVRHKITEVDAPDTDTTFDSLIEFNYREDEDDKESYARIWNGSEMVKDDYLTALYAEHKAMTEIYPSITISTALHNNKLYFNLSNSILSYDLGNNSYAIEKEMGTISVTRDKKVVFGGMSFSYSDGKSESADFVLDNHPIAGIALSKDGKLKVSMATNLAYISGKDDAEYKDDLSTIRQGAYTEDRAGYYGYAFEETNYNPVYSTYTTDMYEGMVNKEINDNDEFMWVANAVKQYPFSELALGTSTKGKEFIGVLCKDEEHAYVEHDEIYFTKDDDNQEWNIGTAYVCVTCGHSVFEPTEPTDIMIQFRPEVKEEYERKLAVYEAAKEEFKKSYKLEGAQWADDYKSVTFSTLNCKYSFDDYQLDILYELKPVELDEPIVIDVITKTENDDGSITYTADSSAIEDYSGYEYYVSITVDKDVVEEKEYSVTIEDGGTNATGSGDYKKGTSVTITAGTKEGYSFKEWTSEDITITDASNETITFEMPEKKVNVKANWTKDELERLAGENRELTAVEVSKKMYDKADNVILANGYVFPDALASSSLAKTLNAPILLAHNNKLNANTLAEIKRLGAKTVYVSGGVQVISEDLVSELNSEGLKVIRVAGDRRESTAVEIGKLVVDRKATDTAIVVNGFDFPDALSVGAAAAAKGYPILFVNTNQLTDTTKDALANWNIKNVKIIGGEKVVSKAIMTELETKYSVERIAGENRETTAIEVAKKFFPDSKQALIANGYNFPDGLVGGPLAAELNAPVLLANTDKMRDEVKTYLEDTKDDATILGGFIAMSKDLEKQIYDAVNKK